MNELVEVNISLSIGTPILLRQSPVCSDCNHGFSHHRVRLSLGMNNYTTDPFQHKNYGPGIPVQFGPLVDISNTPYVYLTDQHRSLIYAAVQDEWRFAKDWAFTAGIRFDSYSDFGSAVSPRLTLVWNAAPELVAKLLYGRAFRPPSFGEMHQQNNPAVIGNVNLNPETIDTVEIAFDYKPLKSLRFGLNLFEYRIKGLIDYVADPAPATTKTAQNAYDQKGHGFEAEADWIATDIFALRANFSYQRSTYSDTGAVVPDVPAMKFYANAHWKFMPLWSLDGQYFWVGDRHRAASKVNSSSFAMYVSLTDILNQFALYASTYFIAFSICYQIQFLMTAIRVYPLMTIPGLITIFYWLIRKFWWRF